MVEFVVISVNCWLGGFRLVVDYPSSPPRHFCLPNSFHEKIRDDSNHAGGVLKPHVHTNDVSFSDDPEPFTMGHGGP